MVPWPCIPILTNTAVQIQSGLLLATWRGSTHSGTQVLKRRACREQNVNGSFWGDCGVCLGKASSWEIHKEKVRERCLCMCSNERGYHLRRGSVQAGLRSDFPTWTCEPRGFLPLTSTSDKGDLWLPAEGKTPTLLPMCRKGQRDPQKCWNQHVINSNWQRKVTNHLMGTSQPR